MRKHWRILVLGVVVSAAAIFMIFREINPTLLAESLRSAFTPKGILWFAVGSMLAMVGLLMRAIRWRVLLSGGLPLRRAFNIINIAYLVNGVLPLRAGEVARCWLASRGADGVPILKSASTIILERLLDLLAVVLFIAIGLAAAADSVPDQLRATGGFMGVVAFVGFLVLVFFAGQRALAQRILDFFVQRIPLLQKIKLSEWLDHFLDGLKPLTHPLSLANALLWTAVSWMFSFISGYVLMFIFYDQADAVATLLYIAAASFAVAIPATVGNIGTYEYSILLALGALGYTATPDANATATAFAFTVHFMNLMVNAILGVIGFLAEGVSLAQITRGVQEVQSAEST